MYINASYETIFDMYHIQLIWLIGMVYMIQTIHIICIFDKYDI